MLDDAIVFLRSTRKESGNIDEGNDRNIEAIAEAYKAGALAAGVAVQNTRQNHGLIGDDPHGVALDVPEADEHVAVGLLVGVAQEVGDAPTSVALVAAGFGLILGVRMRRLGRRAGTGEQEILLSRLSARVTPDELWTALVEGRDLMVEVPPEEAIGILVQVCSGLQAAHDQGTTAATISSPEFFMRYDSGTGAVVNPGMPIPPFVAALTGITDSLVAGAPPLRAVLPTFLEFLRAYRDVFPIWEVSSQILFYGSSVLYVADPTVPEKFRAEFLNAMNHSNLALPNTAPTNSLFGKITAIFCSEAKSRVASGKITAADK